MANQFRARVAAIGIRERLVLLVLAMLVPWIVLFATTYASYQRDHERDTRARLRDLAAQVGARVDDQLGTVDGLLVAIAEGASADPASVARNDEILRRLREELPPYITNLARTNEQIWRIQWDINRRWSAIATREENGVFGIDFQYRKRFK